MRKNPILPGFNPDPSIIFVKGIYYIATSTFQWYPGVRIYQSNNLVDWELAAQPLDHEGLLNLLGVPDSAGVWAPCLSYDGSTFYLTYTATRSLDGMFKDTPNFLTTSQSIHGPWTDPVYLNSSGFDPSLFHDEDGRKYLLNMLWDHRPWAQAFGGILMQEYDQEKKSLVGPVRNIFKGSNLGITEGPHLYKKNGFYYLLTAEGGTSENHAVSICRSVNPWGPYEIHPENPILTSKDKAHLPLQKAGHGDLIKGPEDQWFMVHLCSRPGVTGGYSVLGRETAIQKIIWQQDWPYLDGQGNDPAEVIDFLNDQTPDLESASKSHSIEFCESALPGEFQWLRSPYGIDHSLSDRPGWLRLFGRESLTSCFETTLLGLRMDTPAMSFQVSLDYDPDNFQQMAGLAAYYDTRGFFFLHVSKEDESRVLHLLVMKNGAPEYCTGQGLPLQDGPIDLKGTLKEGRILFEYRQKSDPWKTVGGGLKADVVSDDYPGGWRFTGAFWAIASVDLTGQRMPADFSSIQISRSSQ